MKMVPEGVCIHCGTRAGPLFRQYSQAVLKLTECARCGNIADKYLEYDPVIIIVDLVLLSKAAFRHVLYNTSFKAYWKLFVILLILDTYVDWESSKLYKHSEETVINYVIKNDSYLHIFNNSYNFNVNTFIPKRAKEHFFSQSDVDDPFMFQMKLYLTFLCSLFAMTIFFTVAYIFSIFFGLSSLLLEKVDSVLFCKSFTLASGGNFLLLPALIWGSEHDRSVHLLLVLAYTFVALTYVHSVIFQCGKIKSSSVILIAYFIKICISSRLKAAMLLLI